MQSYEQKLVQLRHDLLQELDSARQHMASSVNTKADFRDVDALSQKLHMKLDIEQAKHMISDARADFTKGGESNKGTFESLQKRISEDIHRLAEDMHALSD